MKYISFFLFYSVTSLFFVSAKELTVIVTDINQQPVTNIVVFLTPINKSKSLPLNKTPLIISQHHKQFTPYVTVTQKGSNFTFKNLDDITHHIYSVSGKNRFSFKIKAGNSQNSPQLDHVEEIAMGCNIHDWMSGYALVVDTPYYTKTNLDGIASLKPAEDGDYMLTLWHPQLNVENYKIEQKIIISSTEHTKKIWPIQLPNTLLPLPEQESQDEFEFLQEY